jgi:hypothetical protein
MACNKSCTPQNQNNNCLDKQGCQSGVCPDFIIKRWDTKPSFKVNVQDCDGPLDLTDLVLEASMWAKAKLKRAITADDEYFPLADNIGFEQVMVGDIIVMDRARLPEQMLVTAFDEANKLIKVDRGYHGTTISSWAKGTPLRIMKFMGTTSETEMLYQDILQIDGTTLEDQLVNSFLIYNWQEGNTCLPGCYYLEFKLLKMTALDLSLSISSTEEDYPISFTDPNLTPADFGCSLGSGVEWVRRFPEDSEGFLIKIVDSPTSEL